MKRTTLAFVAHLVRYVSGFDPLPRWGQSQMLVDEAIFVYGGKTDEFNSFGYTGAPSTNELLILPLSSPFSAAAPPWTLLASSNNESTSQGPHIAWSTLSPVNTSMALLLGGIADPNSDISIQTRADSAILIDVFNQLAPTIIAHPDAGYANEPVRRMQHAACTAPDGRVFIIGGVRADGSGNALSQHLIFDSSLSFTLLGSDGGPPAIYGHSCIMLPNGHLLVLGGLSPISGGLVPFDTIWALDTLRVDPEWFQLNISTNALPVPRRNFATALLVDGRILIHGGQDASAQAVYSDGWILDLSGDGVWEEVEVLSQLGARRDHFAVVSGNEVIFGFGYSSSAPAPAPLQIYDSLSNAFVASHTPLPSPPSPTIPGPVQTSKPAQTNTNTSVRPTRTSSHGGDDDDDGNGSGGDGGGHGGNDNGNGSENDGSRSSSVTAIAVGSALGALGVFLIIGGVIWYYRRQSREEYRKGLFAPLDDGEDGFGGSPGSGVGVGIVSAAAVGTAAGLPSEKGGPFMEHPVTSINDLGNASTRNHIYSNISNASFATPFTPSPASSRFSVNQGSDGVVGAVGRGVGTVTSVVGAGVASLAGLLGLSSAHQRAHYARGDTRPPPSAVRMLPERRDMLSDEDTREFAYPNPSHRRWRSGASSERRRAWFDYERRRADGSAGSAWSLLSIFGAGARSREPSHGGSSLVSSRVATPWNEKGDPFDGEWRSGSGSGYGEEGYVSVFTDNAASGGSRPGMRREYSHSSAPSRKSSLRYVDPFADPAPREPDKNRDLGGITLSGGVAVLGAHALSGPNKQQAKDGHAPENGGELGAPDLQLPSIRTVLPSSQMYTQTLSTLSEQSSHPSLQSPTQHALERTNSPSASQSASHLSDSAQLSRSRADSSASSNQLLSSFDRPSSSHTSFGAHQAVQQQSSPSDTPSTAKSQQTSYFGARPSSILDPPTSPTMSTTLISSAPTQPLRRSDTWWGRFARTRFLDRGSSDASRRGPSSGLVDIRDPNPPPRLNPIEENQHSGSATSGGAAGAHEKAETHVQGIHNGKSTTSLQTTRTMDSEALERLGGTMQVVQRIRDASGSADSGNTSFRRLSRVDTLSSNDSGYDADVAVLAGMFTNRSPEEKLEDVMTPLATSPMQSPNSPGAHSSPTKTPSTPSSRPPPPRLAPGGKVASRVAAYERRMSQDVDSPIASPVGVKEDKTRRKHVDYGLAPRPSLFVTNPDSRKGSTSDS
ncbi:hypothetical protein PTI98_010290 [Pleurotus ostreatus]|nr:hypothetical protein PTI98_010290 [Pleurotus ostreatus]